MNDLLKKGFFLGLGAGAILKETLEKNLADAAKRGEDMTEETSQVAKDVVEEMQRQLDELQAKGADAFEKQMAEAGIASKSDLDAIHEKISALEARIQALEAK